MKRLPRIAALSGKEAIAIVRAVSRSGAALRRQFFALCGLTLLATAWAIPPAGKMPAVRVSAISTPSGIAAPGAKWIAIENDAGRKFVAAVFRPEGRGPFPVVVALHGASGLQDRYLDVAAELARHGFLVIAGCWQAAKNPIPICAKATPEDEWVADPANNSGKELIAAVRYLPRARANRIALYGMSRGGHAALWAAASGARVRAVVVDGAAHRPALAEPPPSTLEVLRKISVPVLLMHGTNDPVIPVVQSRQYEKVALARGKPVDAVYSDGGGHMVSVQNETRPEAIRHAVAFLRERLR
jgi:dienelactone hydrolase